MVWRRRSLLLGAVELRLAVEQLATDLHALDLVGAGAGLVELGVAQQTSGRELVDEAVAAQFELAPGSLIASGPTYLTGHIFGMYLRRGASLPLWNQYQSGNMAMVSYKLTF